MKRFLDEATKEYIDGTPIVSDDVFDAIERLYPTDIVGAEDGEIEHKYRMYSLNKIYSISDLPFSEKYIESPKLDGAAISLLYIYGVLDKALTRGDGKKGFDITDKVKHIVKTALNIKTPILFITGEIVAPKHIENSRNYASGALKLKSLDEFKERVDNLNFIAYDAKGLETNSYTETLNKLKELEFNTVIDSQWSEYPQDGKVLRIDDNKIFDSYGHTAKYPKGAIALKDRKNEEVKETTLRDVIWQVGGSKVTPVAIFDEVVLNDAKVTRATLHNAGFVEDLDLHIGDTLIVRRAGNIIPSVIGKVSV